MKKLNVYVAFLRGINVGGNTMIKMEELKKTFASLGFSQIHTVLNSGNIIFETSETDCDSLIKKIGEKLQKTFGFTIGVQLRTRLELKSLVDADPFKKITLTSQTKLYVTFLLEKPKAEIAISDESPEKDFRIVCIFDREVCSFVELSSMRGTPELMKLLEKAFGKKITTRTWNTVLKVHHLLV